MLVAEPFLVVGLIAWSKHSYDRWQVDSRKRRVSGGPWRSKNRPPEIHLRKRFGKETFHGIPEGLYTVELYARVRRAVQVEGKRNQNRGHFTIAAEEIVETLRNYLLLLRPICSPRSNRQNIYAMKSRKKAESDEHKDATHSELPFRQMEANVERSWGCDQFARQALHCKARAEL